MESRKWMIRPSVTFGRMTRGTVQHVVSGAKTACGMIDSSDLSHKTDQPGYFKLPVCERCVVTVTAELNATTRMADAVYVTAHKEGMGGR